MRKSIKDLLYASLFGGATTCLLYQSRIRFENLYHSDQKLLNLLSASQNGLKLAIDSTTVGMPPEKAQAVQKIAIEYTNEFITEATRYKAVESIVDVQQKLEATLKVLENSNPTTALVQTTQMDMNNLCSHIGDLAAYFNPTTNTLWFVAMVGLSALAAGLTMQYVYKAWKERKFTY